MPIVYRSIKGIRLTSDEVDENFRYLDEKAVAIVFDDVPIDGSENPVKSNGIFDAIATSESNTRSYADGLVVGLWDDRGNYNASTNLFPSSGGSGTVGGILKGDIWTISVAGTLGGSAVTIGDTVRALVDSPGSTSTNWAIAETNVGYVPENITNKATDFSVQNNTLYASVLAIVNYVAAFWTTAKGAVQTIGGVWTFSVSPIVPTVPSGGTAAINKDYFTANVGLWSPVQSTQNITGAVSIDLSVAQVFYLTLTGNVTGFTFTNAVVGKQYMFYFIKGTTNYAFVWTAAKYRFPFATAPTLTDCTTNGTPVAPNNYSIDIITAFCAVTGRLDIVRTPDLQNN